MILCVLNPEKLRHQELVISPPYLYTIATLPWEIQKSDEYATPDTIRYARRQPAARPL